MKRQFAVLLLALFCLMFSSCAIQLPQSADMQQDSQSDIESNVESDTESNVESDAGSAPEAFEVTFTCNLLEDRVRATIQRPAGKIMSNELNTIRVFTFYANVENDAGISLNNQPNISYGKKKIDPETLLKQCLNDLRQFDQLQSFTCIAKVSISHNAGNPIFDSLGSCPNLEEINMNGVGLDDLRFLANMQNLRKLSLKMCDLSSINGLEQCRMLKKLSLNQNDITDIGPLSGLSDLEYLDLSDNQITDISVLSALSNLESLSLKNNKITDYTPVDSLTKIRNYFK